MKNIFSIYDNLVSLNESIPDSKDYKIYLISETLNFIHNFTENKKTF